ncbi:MAG: response regulator FixJ [Phycisphaeraceae bacterium]
MEGWNSDVVAVIDDDRAVRDSLQWLLESGGLQIRAFATAQDFLAALEGGHRPGAALVDVRLPGMSGLDLQQRLNEMGLCLPVVIITGHGDVPVAVRAMKAGAVDFIEKPFNDQVLLDRVQEALEQGHRLRQEEADLQAIMQRIERLTPREREVMELVVQGWLNKQIAAELGLSPKTVEVHRAHVMEKMEADSLARLVRMAVSLEMVQDQR